MNRAPMAPGWAILTARNLACLIHQLVCGCAWVLSHCQRHPPQRSAIGRWRRSERAQYNRAQQILDLDRDQERNRRSGSETGNRIVTEAVLPGSIVLPPWGQQTRREKLQTLEILRVPAMPGNRVASR